MSHLDEGQLHELLDGELDESARAEALAHLAGCERCRAAYDEARSFLAEADALIDAVQVPVRVESQESKVETAPASNLPLSTAEARRRGRIRTYRTLAWAASLVLAVGLGWYGSTWSRGAPQMAEFGAAGVGAASDAVAPIASEQPTDVPVPAAAPKPELASADKAVRQRAPSAPAVATEEKASVAERAGVDEVLGAAANQAALPASEPVTTSTAGEAASGLMAREAVPVPVQPAPPAAYAPVDRETRRKERDASQSPEGPQLDNTTRPFASKRAPALRPIAMEQAVRILGGSIRLIDGLVPTRIIGEWGTGKDGTSLVRVVYEDPPGRELWLDQQRVTAVADMRAETATALLPGDTTEVAGPGAAKSLRWVDQSGFQLALTGFLPVDSLRQLLRRVQ